MEPAPKHGWGVCWASRETTALAHPTLYSFYTLSPRRELTQEELARHAEGKPPHLRSFSTPASASNLRSRPKGCHYHRVGRHLLPTYLGNCEATPRP